MHAEVQRDRKAQNLEVALPHAAGWADRDPIATEP